MRPEIKRMNERLAYFLSQMDLDNAHIRHAEERIEELERELKIVQSNAGFLLARNIELENIEKDYGVIGFKYNNLLEENKRLENAVKVLKDANYQMCQSVQAENDRLERNEKLEKENIVISELNNELLKENAKLMNALKIVQQERDEAQVDKNKCNFYKTEACKLEGIYWEMDELRTSKEDTELNNAKLAKEIVEIQEAYNDLEQAYSTLKEEYHELVLKYEETQRIEGHHYCDCGAVAYYIHHQIGVGKYYCGQCFKRDVIKL